MAAVTIANLGGLTGNLERALEAHPDHPFEIEWHPFQLNPEMVAEGVPKRDYLAARFGGTCGSGAGAGGGERAARRCGGDPAL